jgi:hypothetical protein
MDVSLPVGFYPFWFWNDTLSADEIRWQVTEMADKGIRGFYIHSRQGLGQPYLSESFFQMVDVAVAAAKERGMFVHLYDEYPYPSGIAGGEVVLGCPQYYATRLVHKSCVLDGGRIRLELPRGKVLSCVAYPRTNGQVDWEQGIDLCAHVGVMLVTDSYLETGLTQYNRKRYFASEPTPILDAMLPQGTYELFVSVQSPVSRHKYWNQFVDVLNPEAVERFISLTHERYRRRYADQFGETIISIFTDETYPHWSDRLPEAFLAEYGYDLCAVMPALQHPDHPEHVRVSHDLYRLVYEMFCASFEEPVSSWCRQNGLAYAGEKPSLRMSQLRYMDIPGCEPGHTKVGAKLDLLQGALRGNAKGTASAAYFYDKLGALCECYHSTGWSATLQDAKFIADGLLLMGIKYLVPHGFFYSTHALKKHDAPPTFFFQMPFWPSFGRLAERVDRMGRLFEDTYIDADVLLIEPSSGLPTRQDRGVYKAIHWLLMENHLDYHVVDTDVLRSGQIEGGRVHVADILAQVVIVPPMRVIETPLQDWLNEYVAVGGVVLYCDAERSLAPLGKELLKAVQPSLSIQADGEEAKSVLVVKRVAEDRTLWFVLNTANESIDAALQSGGVLREVPLAETLPGFLYRENGGYKRTIQPFESFLLEAVPSPVPINKLPQIEVYVGGQAKLHLENENLLRMYDWHMSLVGENDDCGQSATVQAVPLANQLERGQFSFAPEYVKSFGHVPELAFPEFHICYEYAFNCAYAGPVQLIMEPGSIVGEWSIYVNDAGPFTLVNLTPTAAHVRGSLGFEITDLLCQGRNTVRVEVVTARADGGLLNPLYLAGDFGVALHPVRLLPREDDGLFERYKENLLPYYAGVIEYTIEFSLDRIPDSDQLVVAFEYDRPFHEATEVSVNGSEYVPVLWQPRCTVLPADRLRVGNNVLHTRVYTTQIRAFEGQWFDYVRHEYRDVGEWTNDGR